ncbi:tRNA-intron endonuclease catalytic domain-like protein [Conidiobolus coronatus NRRL 28638]|uniref:tRNA-splicing endonuclease subunit Sen2 n=1 Tax=Conidiobolus coronatus (strain ATCC 28846 / CBS 209.66 / NRRL 28638) TaxID=796925 RepID=A0A137PC07_CONC2|nr:tRNA-intron endonuclease catalytic domain-like protein [Conidiobolus coronatus NRRL 28638]|eukprot:KXN72505.1 tRNA-intron endonuclease catalytic domain-like protein [Conidiobolus coronatus NRRL 28638]
MKNKKHARNNIQLLPLNYLINNTTNKFINAYLVNPKKCNSESEDKISIRGGGVEVRDPIKMKEIWFGGFFGKGIYSRSSPQFQIENETLWLNIEELIFLNYNLGILKLYLNPTSKEEIEYSQVWSIILNNTIEYRKKLELVCNYCAYYYFRSKKWIVKSGLKYGTKYVLYRDGPTNKHSEYSVNITLSSITRSNKALKSQNIPLVDLIGSIRLCGSVQKKYMICFVVYPDNIKLDQLFDLNWILNNFRVHLVQFSRWLPERTRS